MTTTFPGEPSVSNMKAQINGILDSYHRDYDVLAELVQNSIDAIRDRLSCDILPATYVGKVKIYIDSEKKQIKITDNGSGMDKYMLERSVALNESGKRGSRNSIGEKGVGLSFAIFKSQNAIIKTYNGKETGYKIIGNEAKAWLNSDSDEKFIMETVEDNEFKEQGTQVDLQGLELGDLFSLSWEQMEYVVRTLTAAGDTNSLFDKESDEIEISLEYNNPALGIDYLKKEIDYEYFLFDGVADNQKVEFKDFEKKFKGAEKTDSSKREYLKGKYVIMRGQRAVASRMIDWIAMFAPSSDDWDQRNKKVKLEKDDGFDLEVEPNYAKLRPIATLSVKGMPTGIELSTSELTGALGYLPRMSLLIQDDGANFDLGRKTVKGSTTITYKSIIKEAFDKYKSIASKYIARDKNPISDNEGIEKLSVKFNRLKRLENLDPEIQKITFFEKVPDQEGTISAIFFGLMAKKTFGDIRVFRHGYDEMYDLYAQKNDADITIDFKQRLKGFVDDAHKNTKRWNDLNYLVMWDLDDSDNKVADENGIDITSIGRLDEEKLMATAYLTSQMTNDPIYVVELKKVLDFIIKKD